MLCRRVRDWGKGQEGCVHGVKLLIHQEGQVQTAAGGGQGTLGWGLGRSEPTTLCQPPGRVHPPPLPPTVLRTPGWREPRNLGDPHVMTARAGDPAHRGGGHLRRGPGVGSPGRMRERGPLGRV